MGWEGFLLWVFEGFEGECQEGVGWVLGESGSELEDGCCQKY